MEMFNDLRGSRELRDHYQFWFYLYPTGQPFWFSAAHLRQELADARYALDPHRQSPALDQTVLVGHSMGGLISLLQTIDSKQDFWKMASPRPFERLNCVNGTHDNLQHVFFFTPNPSIRRVVTIATPHQGSNFANMATRWLGRKLINLPDDLVALQKSLLQGNPNYFPENSVLEITTAVDALSNSSPVWEFMKNAERAPWVTYHNIIGNLEDTKLGKVAGRSDGVVTVESASCEMATSEIMVPAEHTEVHRQPAAILEVNRVLREHLAEVRASQGVAMVPE
jgi:hypothetical protein